ncbi:MAG: DUF1343 domain-containing protein [Gelidibacter sp.]
MRLMMFKNTVLLFVLIVISCGSGSKTEDGRPMTDDQSQKLGQDGRPMTDDQSQKPGQDGRPMTDDQEKSVPKAPIVGANQTDAYLKILKGKKIGIVANQTSVLFKDGGQKTENQNYTHLVDSLVSLKIDVKKVFAPEHGFRGTADAGEQIKDGLDKKTGIPIISLYGDNKKPKLEQLKETKQYEKDIETNVSAIDIMVFDLQDVGARFYTYISTLHYVMEACAEAHIPLLVLDRPNPNGNYIDGPILEKEHSSFVGMHPIPIVHGMTIGEYAQMINGEKWLKNGVQCQLTVIPVKNYTHQTSYSLPIKPSPNLPNDVAIKLYPSLCFFEGTTVSVGRGTNKQFQIFGSPALDKNYYTFNFTPQPNEGAKSPLYQGKVCFGKDLSTSQTENAIDLKWLIEAYNHTSDKKLFFNDFFTKLAGTKKLRQQIEQGMSEEDIKSTWQNGLKSFKEIRKKYLIYD